MGNAKLHESGLVQTIITQTLFFRSPWDAIHCYVGMESDTLEASLDHYQDVNKVLPNFLVPRTCMVVLPSCRTSCANIAV